MGLYNSLVKAQMGDEEAILSIFIKFRPTIKKFSKKINYEEVETDLIIALLEMINTLNLNNFNPENEGALINFTHKFLKNTSVNLFKKNILRHVNTIELDINTVPYNYDFDSQVFISLLLNSLPTLQKEVIKRKFIYGFSDKEIAQSYGISRQAVNRAKNRGLNNLKKSLVQNGGKNVG